MNSWSIISNNSNNNNKTGKLTIPILNSASPHNYVIMPALLAHVDSPLPLTCFSPSRIQRHSNNTESTFSSLCTAKSRRYKKLNSLNSNSICNEKNFSSSFKPSKEIIYTTKKIKPLNSKEEKFTEAAINESSLLSTINENFFSRSDHNHPTSYFDYSSYTVMVGKEVADSPINIRNIDYSQYELNQNSMSCSFTQTETNEPFTTDNTNSSIATTHHLDTSSLINMIPNSDAKPSESYINESTHSTSEYLSLFNQLATTTLDNQDIASRYVNCYLETPSSFRMDQYQEVETDFNNNQITYAISYPSDWQYNLDSLLNCYVAFKNIKTQNTLLNTVQLKCSVCETEFVRLIDLVKHKEENDFCKNNIQISTEHNSASKFFLAPVNKRKSYLINHLENEEEESENEYEYEEGLNESFFFDTDTDEEEAILFDEIIDSSDESSLNDDLSLYSNQKNAKLTKIRYKSRIESEFNKSKSSKTVLLEPSFARHKYTKNKNDPKNFSNSACEICSKNCKTKAELLVHKHKHAGHDAECWQCGKKCASFSNLISHIQLHTGEKPYACQFCGKQFTQDAHLTRHIRLHTGERPFACEICGKNYKDYSYYKTHLRIHRGERLYKCKFCNKEYYDASYYKKHTRLHTGEKPYMCTVCGRQFHRSDYLKLHSFSHTNERPFNCHICGKGFKMNYNLKIHLKHHKNEQSNIASAKDQNTYLDSINNISSDNYLNTYELMVEQSNDLNSSSINLLSTSVSNEMTSFLNESM